MKIALIVAAARNGVIGGGNKMLWRVPEDFAHFKRTTMGHPIVMGRKTWESIGRPLPGRRNVVVTRNPDYRAEGAEVASSLEDAFKRLGDAGTVFVIGGGEIYRQALPMADVVWLTRIAPISREMRPSPNCPRLSGRPKCSRRWSPSRDVLSPWPSAVATGEPQERNLFRCKKARRDRRAFFWESLSATADPGRTDWQKSRKCHMEGCG